MRVKVQLILDVCLITNEFKIPLVNCSFNGKEVTRVGEALAKLPKVCMGCNKIQKDILILQCQCMLCKPCLRHKLLEKNEKLLTSSFEAGEGKEATCVCPIHNWRIEPQFLQAIFTPEELEGYTLDAFKRQLREVKRRKFLWPNVCVDCKRAISESIKNYQIICYRHKICKDCIE